MKIAFVHDYLNQMGGAENLLELLCEAYPDAPVYTSVVNFSKLRKSFRSFNIKHSFMQKLPFIEKHSKKYLPLYPIAFEQMKLNGFDVIFSISSGFAKGVSYEPGALHINYCLTPMRFAWMFKQYNDKEKVPAYYLPFLLPLLKKYKKWDLDKNKQVHKFITLSTAVQQRIKEWYKRDSEVVFPPVDVSRFVVRSHCKSDYYLIVSRLRGYKRIDLAIKACSKLNLPLKIVGSGDQRKYLEKIAGPTVEFLGYQSDEEVLSYMQNCRAFIFPGEEDFGIAPLEAQACGKPVIAFRAGGALDTIVDGETGVLFREQTEESLIDAIKVIEANKFSDKKCRQNAMRFSNDNFKKEIQQYIEKEFYKFKHER